MLQALSSGRAQRERHQSEGDAALLVVVDSGGAYHARSIVDETVLTALEHFGLPYRLLDLARARPTAEALRGCAEVVLAQDGVAGRLSQAEAGLIAGAVAEAGVGLVNLDWDLRQCPAPLLEVFGFDGVERLPIASDLFFAPDNAHYVTGLQEARAFHKSRRMVTALVVPRWGEAVTPLVELVLGKDQLVYIRHLVPGSAFEPKHYPVVFAARRGRGRAVQYAVNPRLWRAAALGHLGGLGDVFWRSLVWAARKPLAANAIPPFLTMSFDDCSGRQDFRYLEVCRRHGFRPLASLFIDDVRDRHLPLLRGMVQAGDIIVNTHAMSYYDLPLYDFGVGEHGEAALRERFERDDRFYQRLGAACARTLRDHWGEVGVRSLPYLKARGRLFINTPVCVGEHKADQFVPPDGDGYWPFNSTQCFYDALPDDNDFTILGAFHQRHLADFLTGSTLLLRESPVNDVPKAAASAAFQIRHGLANGFFADIVTHEHKFSVLSLEEWDQILARAGQLTAGFEKSYAHYDDIARYVKSKDQTWIARAVRTGERVHCQIAGQAEVPLRLSIYNDRDDGVERTYVDAPPFDGQAEVN